MGCIELILAALLSISICHPAPSYRRLPGRWVGTIESRGELKAVSAEFVRGDSGLTGALHVEGEGDLPLLRAGESRSRAWLEAGELVFVGAISEGAIVGSVLRGGEQTPFELHRAAAAEATASPPAARPARRRW